MMYSVTWCDNINWYKVRGIIYLWYLFILFSNMHRSCFFFTRRVIFPNTTAGKGEKFVPYCKSLVQTNCKYHTFCKILFDFVKEISTGWGNIASSVLVLLKGTHNTLQKVAQTQFLCPNWIERYGQVCPSFPSDFWQECGPPRLCLSFLLFPKYAS